MNNSFEDHSLERPFHLIYPIPIILPIERNFIFYIYLIEVDGLKKCVMFLFIERIGRFYPIPNELSNFISSKIRNPPDIPLVGSKIRQTIQQLDLKYGNYILTERRNVNEYVERYNHNGQRINIEPRNLSLFYVIANLYDMVKFVAGVRRKFSNTADPSNRFSNRYILYTNIIDSYLLSLPIRGFKSSNAGERFKEFINTPEIKHILSLFRKVNNRSNNIELKNGLTNNSISKDFLNDMLQSKVIFSR